ncbi:uncharacterized protein LOC124131385 isoform X3 [Haliotis rufescens]|uniref:uncharacterized protein LOC124131385 isoform X3 n=1 Tax=Haliotis rufescens TaxID=6454 RepID=UPI00201F6B57|nr:uncharacterized protein LOC124131385 isoform X3 [Haliotis rufescens]
MGVGACVCVCVCVIYRLYSDLFEDLIVLYVIRYPATAPTETRNRTTVCIAKRALYSPVTRDEDLFMTVDHTRGNESKTRHSQVSVSRILDARLSLIITEIALLKQRNMMTELHFREVRNGVALSQSGSPVVVDVACNENVFEMLDKEEKVEEIETLFCIHWEHSPDVTYVLSSVTLSMNSQAQVDLQHELAKSLARNTTMLQQFISDLFKSFHAKLVAVKYAPLRFILLHKDKESLTSMARNSSVLQAIFKEMMSTCCSTLPQVQLRMKLFNSSLPPCAEVKRECFFQSDNEFRTDSMYMSYLPSMHRAVSTDTILHDIEAEDNKESIDKRFGSLEHEISEHRRVIEAQIREQREQSDEIREALSMITQRIRRDSKKDAQQIAEGQLVLVTEPIKSSERSLETTPVIKGSTKGLEIKKETVTTKPQTHLELKSSTVCTNDVKAPLSDVEKESSENQSNGIQPFTDVDEIDDDHRKSQHDIERVGGLSDSKLREEKLKEKPHDREHDAGKESNEIRRSACPGDKPILEVTGKTMEVLAAIKSALAKHYEVGNIWECVEKTLGEEGPQYPKARGVMNTVLCLDTSSSIGEEGLRAMKHYLAAFIDGIEETAEELEQEENIAIVTFGGGASALHPLSNDYGSLRDAIEDIQCGGSSPLLQGLLVSVAALAIGQHGDSVETSQPSRIIVMTDGLVSGERASSDIDTKTTCLTQQDKNRLVSTLRILRPKESLCKEFDAMVWIPVGDANTTFLQDMVTWSDGKLLNGKEIQSLCRHRGHQRDPGKRASPLSSFGGARNTEGMSDTKEADETSLQDTVTRSDGKGLEETEMPSGSTHRDIQSDSVNSATSLSSEAGKTSPTLAAEKYGPASRVDVGARRSDRRATDVFDNIYESEGLPSLGSRVVRGADWKWDDQDMGVPGTITNHGEGKSVWVAWDHGECNRYRYGLGGHSDVKVVDDQPRSPRRDGRIQIGMQVERGADWQQKYNDDDGGSGSYGTVIRRQADRVMVKWRTGKTREYRYGLGGKFDLCVRDPVACLVEQTTKQQTLAQSDQQRTAPTDGVPKKKGASDRNRARHVWQWLNGDGVWITYSDEHNIKLSSSYENKKDGHCMIEKDGKRFLVLFEHSVEKSLTDRFTRKVRKYPIGWR